jgi:hypothetical protein
MKSQTSSSCDACDINHRTESKNPSPDMKDASNPESGVIETKSLKKSINCKNHKHHNFKGSSASPMDHNISTGKRSNSRA